MIKAKVYALTIVPKIILVVLATEVMTKAISIFTLEIIFLHMKIQAKQNVCKHALAKIITVTTK